MKREPRRKHRIPSSAYPARRPYRSAPAGRRRRPIPERIWHFYIPLAVLEATDRAMRRFGRENRECYVWWGGYYTADGDGQVVTALWPEVDSEFGRIHLNNRQLSALHSQLRSLDQVLLVELHTHPPGGGGQNEVDAAHPATTYRGFISIVVPGFAFPHFYDLRESYVYEYLGESRWRQLEGEEIEERFVVEEAYVSVDVGDGTG